MDANLDAKTYFIDLADYHLWANDVLFSSVDALPAAAAGADEGLFFGSVLGTMNHLLVGTRIWFGRLRGNDPKHLKLDQFLHADWAELKQALRSELSQTRNWIAAQPAGFFDSAITYTNTRGEPFTSRVVDVLTHAFTHFNHHRGQASVAVTRQGGNTPEMDYIFWCRLKDAGRL
jgi:uncharacterized damage-inducible protein DinB